MTDKMKQFLEEAGKDAAFAEKLNGADSVETVLALAKEKGFELTEEDLQPDAPTGELADEALDDVAGGMLLGPLATWSGLTSLLSRRFGRRRDIHTLEQRGVNLAPQAQTLEVRTGAGTPTPANMLLHIREEESTGKFFIV